MGSYTPVERELSHLSIDEINEMYLNGDLHKVYDEFERTNEVSIEKKKRKRKRKEKSE